MLRNWLAIGMTLLLVVALADAQQRRGNRADRRSDKDALKVGQAAPTFKLKSLDGKATTDLGTWHGKRPVLLFFGSYT